MPVRRLSFGSSMQRTWQNVHFIACTIPSLVRKIKLTIPLFRKWYKPARIMWMLNSPWRIISVKRSHGQINASDKQRGNQHVLTRIKIRRTTVSCYLRADRQGEGVNNVALIYENLQLRWCCVRQTEDRTCALIILPSCILERTRVRHRPISLAGCQRIMYTFFWSCVGTRRGILRGYRYILESTE